MKAVVLEIKGDKAAVMTSDGCVRRIDNMHFDIGQQIIVSDSQEKKPLISRTAQKVMKITAAAAAFLLMVARGTYIYSSPYGVVSLDVNPSVEFTINRLDKVLYVNGVNDDGRNILDNLNGNKLINMDIEKAVDVTIDQIESEGYFAGEDRNYVVVAANTIQETHTDKLVNKLDGSLTNNQKVQPITMKASDDDLTAAREKGTSPGKMMIVENLDSVCAESINKDEWLEKSVADIVHEYKKCTNNEEIKVAEAPSDNGSESRPIAKASASAKKACRKAASDAAKDVQASKEEQTDQTGAKEGTASVKPAASQQDPAVEAAVKDPLIAETPVEDPAAVLPAEQPAQQPPLEEKPENKQEEPQVVASAKAPEEEEETEPEEGETSEEPGEDETDPTNGEDPSVAAEEAPDQPEEEPAVEAPAVEEPVVEEPVVEAPAEEAPVEEAPAEEAPAEETPVEEAPAEEAPVQEVPAE